MRIKILLAIAVIATLASATAQSRRERNQPKQQQSADTVAKPKPGTIAALIKPNANKQTGMFTVYEQDGKYFFLVPESLLGKDILVVNRLSQSAAGLRNGFAGYAGDQIYNAMIRLSKSPDGKKIFVNRINTRERSQGDMAVAVEKSNKQPIVQAFDIKASTPAKDSVLIEVTDFLNGESELISFSPSSKQSLGLSGMQRDASYIVGVKTFPINTEIKTVKSYNATPTTGNLSANMMRQSQSVPATFEINASFVLLPQVPMQPRYNDPRVGYFTERYVDFDQNPQGVKNVEMITRWRLEPKPEDVEKYKRGELVEPAEPIIFYIDPATPKQWVSSLIQGVNDWEPVFRKAGFKNAIKGLEAPVDDPNWSLEDARYSAIVYKPSDIPNASGPHNRDPRSGQIIESHINWYHNVMLLLRNWYMLQVGPNDPRAQQMEFPSELMGELVRFVSSHEVGHTLGLRHNFGATATAPVDSLRSRTYLQKYGHTPSIMDYSRFNYVVQPEDGIEPELQYPRIKEYDEWAIEWGYRRFPDLKTPEAEATKLNEWIIEKQKNPRLWFGHESNPNDPRSQAEDLGDNQMKANELGIKNLQRVVVGLPKWTYKPNSNYADLGMMHGEVVTQFGRYIGHVSKWIGGIYENPVTREQGDVVYTFVEKDKQKEAMAFLDKHLYNAPKWLLDQTIYEKTGANGTDVMLRLYNTNMNSLLSNRVMQNLINAQATLGAQAYTMTDLYADLSKAVWGTGVPDVYRRILQKAYINSLINLSGLKDAALGSMVIVAIGADVAKTTDIQSMAVYQLRQAQYRIGQLTSSDPVVQAHYQHLGTQIKNALEGK